METNSNVNIFSTYEVFSHSQVSNQNFSFSKFPPRKFNCTKNYAKDSKMVQQGIDLASRRFCVTISKNFQKYFYIGIGIVFASFFPRKRRKKLLLKEFLKMKEFSSA